MSTPPQSIVRFWIEADADADVLARIANILLLANRAPVSGSLAARSPDRLILSFNLPDLAPATAELIRRKLVRLTCVADVDMRPAAAEILSESHS